MSTTRPRCSRSARAVEVKVLDIDRERQRISLGLKQTQSDPWQQVIEAYQEGDVVEGRVTKVVTFGAFVEILPGVEGLVHISELAQHHVENPREIVSQGEVVRVKIIEMDADRRRLSLSLKRVEDTDEVACHRRRHVRAGPCPAAAEAEVRRGARAEEGADEPSPIGEAEAPSRRGRRLRSTSRRRRRVPSRRRRGRRAGGSRGPEPRPSRRRARRAVEAPSDVAEPRPSCRGGAEAAEAPSDGRARSGSRRRGPREPVDVASRRRRRSPTSPRPRATPSRDEPGPVPGAGRAAGRRRHHRRHRRREERDAARLRASRRCRDLERRDRPPSAARRIRR